MARIKDKKSEGNENFGPVAANVFLEDVEELDQGSNLPGFARHRQEDGTKRKGAELNVLGVVKEALDVGASVLVVEAGVDKTNHGTGGFGMEPGCG